MENKRLYLKIDPILLIVALISFFTRHMSIEHPRAIVFDELHYIKFISLYLKGIFFFDTQPPFGKQLLTLAARASGFEGNLSYSQIGDLYDTDVPIAILRSVPCIFGSLIAPICYMISLELGHRQSVSALVSLLIITENSLLTQSRFLLLDSQAIFFSILALYCSLKFSKLMSFGWLILTSFSVTLAVCTKYSALYTYGLILILVGYKWYCELDRWKPREAMMRILAYCACLTVVPITIYMSIYYAHLTWLTKAGPHDTIMSSAFQASLEDGLASITRGQPLEIVHGSQITLRHTHGRSCWLHSHESLYPIKYHDGRGSSHQQQVTCYSFKDVNNWWIVKRPHLDELVVGEPRDRIKDGDLVQLVHGITGRTLNSHDVASAMSPYSQEVSCYVDHNISMPAQDVWKLRLLNPSETGGFWHTLNSHIQLVHLNSSLVLRFSGRQLPDWGFHQHEIICDKIQHHDDTIWNVEEHRFTKSEDQKEREVQLGQAEFVPLEPTQLSFLEKFYELHYKLLTYRQDSYRDHTYACDSPLDWVFMDKGTAYWIQSSELYRSQIFLIGNVSTNELGIICMLILVSFWTFYLMRRRREIKHDLDNDRWNQLQFKMVVVIGGYLAHLLPYFLYEGPLFLQYYLTAIVFKVLAIGVVVDHIGYVLQRHLSKKHEATIEIVLSATLLLIAARSIDTCVKLSPLSYGTRLTADGIKSLRWKDTWQLMSVSA